MTYILKEPLWLLSEEWIAAQHISGSSDMTEGPTAVVLALEPGVMVACTRVVAMDVEKGAEICDIFWQYN